MPEKILPVSGYSGNPGATLLRPSTINLHDSEGAKRVFIYSNLSGSTLLVCIPSAFHLAILPKSAIISYRVSMGTTVKNGDRHGREH
jgi:hypothetical protein